MSSESGMTAESINAIRRECLLNARRFIFASKKLPEGRFNNIKYHLCTIALEEIGKASLITSKYIADSTFNLEKEKNWGLDDHVKKLFWAFWGASFGREKITHELITHYQGIAKKIHENRLDSLYTNPTTEKQRHISNSEVAAMLKMAQGRLGMETAYGGINPNPTEHEKEVLRFFLEASNDPERRNMIFGSNSLAKFEELGDSKLWIEWIYEQFKEANIQGQIDVIKEMNGVKPVGKEASKAKWEITFHVNSESHSIRRKHLDDWNKVIVPIKLFSNDTRDIICKITLPKALHISKLWDAGWDLAKEFILALNIGTMGFFFWKLQKYIDRYYEKIIDLETNTQVIAQPEKILKLNWKDQHLVLDNIALINVNDVMLFLMEKKEDSRFIEIIMEYYMGLTLISKIDLHLRLEINAFEKFYISFVGLMKYFFNYDGKSDLVSFTAPIMDEMIKGIDNFTEVIGMGVDLQANRLDMVKHPITLTEIIAMKMYCDVIIFTLAKKTIRGKGKKDGQ
jgi:AbiV family abortive infection protein